MSKRKTPGVERRRPTPEINLLPGGAQRTVFGKARKGCSLPFLGGGILAMLFVVALQHSV